MSQRCGVPKRAMRRLWGTTMESTVVFNLDSPRYHRLKLGERNRFAGYVFECYGRPIVAVEVYRDGRAVGRFPVDTSSEDVHQFVTHLASTRRCRFDFQIPVVAEADAYALRALYADGSVAKTLRYDVAAVRARRDWLARLEAQLSSVPTPPGDLVFLTQGIRDQDAYRDSVIPAVYNMQAYLERAGVDVRSLRSVLDVGCGTARVLLGWYLDDPDRRLCGCDINDELIAWAQQNLPASMQFQTSALAPPLPYEPHTFDLVCLISVFTHLSLQSQRRWVEEIERVLAPGGVALITLHGEVYVHLGLSSRLEEFRRTGFLSIAGGAEDEGTNRYGTYHTADFARELFAPFTLAACFPRGEVDGDVLFPVAAFQDVYVFKKGRVAETGPDSVGASG